MHPAPASRRSGPVVLVVPHSAGLARCTASGSGATPRSVALRGHPAAGADEQSGNVAIDECSRDRLVRGDTCVRQQRRETSAPSLELEHVGWAGWSGTAGNESELQDQVGMHATDATRLHDPQGIDHL